MKPHDAWFEVSDGRVDRGSYDLILFCGSFEKRCLALASLIQLGDADTHVFLTRGPATSEGYVGMMEGELIGAVKEAGRDPLRHRTYPDNPRLTWLELFSVLKPLVGQQRRTLVDITTMPRELMAMIVAIIGLDDIRAGHVTFAYVPARVYDEDKSWEEVWLSRGVKDIRAIIGYEGKSGSRGHHLLLLNGFELERAKAIISRFEPSSITVAKTGEKGSTHPKFASVQVAVADAIERHLTRPPAYLEIFPKSCSQTYESLLAHISDLESRGERNFVIAPLNTKPSSLAVFLIAMERTDIQVVYAEPQIYNTEHYSEPQDGFYEISIE